MKVIIYDDRYKNQLIEMVSEARVTMGISSVIRSDLYDIKTNYLDKGDMFWIAIDESDVVVGCIGYSHIENSDEAFLHRFYVKASRKNQGIGTKLLYIAEKTMKSKGIRKSKVHLGEPKEIWFESYSFYPKNGYIEYEPRYMLKNL
ncbi:GNAT family N-acetyltransferase [Streptobacillus canis]|uniref:GNAT family N-acetyltransferase n=1 Tax=Streptobacillus canis TaxID=2678686 RepID=UPI0018CC461B|nr:GNAT family N-acetyltransferase [Streptobacillus canis]